ncbi:MAG TPA: PQQ-binding-like beta-propeller repeat protein [Candidatus Bathyarchaeia archaeon]|nr:PQQ-binding-like beta-propeller repeat protein [Candidatus Bathyarchaeia archaeon]
MKLSKNSTKHTQFLKSKTITAIALFLTLTIAIPLAALPAANAHTPVWTIIGYAYVSASPNPVGVGQRVAIFMWTGPPLAGALAENGIRRQNFTLTITKPDGTTETQRWDVVQDSTGIQSYYYYPTQVGNYTIKFDYGGQKYTWNQANTPGLSSSNAAYENDTYTAASRTYTLTVQQEPIPEPISSYPLPSEYWTRPIEGQNTDWYSVASNWLGTPYIPGANAAFGIPGAYQPDGSAPNSAHIMWTKPIAYGGVVGGNSTTYTGEMYYQGGSYNIRYANPLIMHGTLFYQEPYGNSGVGGDYVAVDLRTGEELWRVNTTATGINLVPSFGYLYALETINQHGILPNGLLIASGSVSGQGTVWRGYDPRTGYLTGMNVTNVPGGTNVAGPRGEYLKYTLTNLGTSSNPNWRLMQWNSSKVFGAEAGTGVGGWYTGNIPGNTPFNTTALGTNTYWNGSAWVSNAVRLAQGYSAVQWTTPAYDWNVSVALGRGTWSIGTAVQGVFPLVDLNNILLLIQGTFGGYPIDYSATVTTFPANITAISLKPATLGQVLWTKSYPQAPGNNTRFLAGWDPSREVFVFTDKESMVHYGYSLKDGSQLWGPTVIPEDTTSDWNFLNIAQTMVAYGKLYWSSWAGIIYAFDIQTGKLLWTYGNGGEGNSTSTGLTSSWGRFPTFISVIADGKVYLDTTEHSPNSPLYKGYRFRALNATDGTELWTLFDYANQMYGGAAPIGDGYLTYLNTYDMQIYAIGKGPSSTVASASPKVSVYGTSVLLEGTVMDIAAGTRQPEQAARFPNGVPAVSDESQSSWMEYVYMQKPRPTNVIGVEVTLSVLDANGNFREIGTTTSDASGFYSLMWTPDIPGKYTVVARFAGSESYYPSQAETAFAVDPAPPAPTEPEPQPLIMTDTYIMYSTVAIVIAIAVGFAVAIVLLRKRP